MQYFYQYLYTDGTYKGISQQYSSVRIGDQFQVLKFGGGHREKSETLVKENNDPLDMDQINFTEWTLQ